MMLQESVTKSSWRESLHRRESAISHGSRRPQTETAGAHQWEKPVVSSRQRGIKLQRKKLRRQKERAASLPSSSQTFICPKCCRRCASRIGLYSHQRACKNWPSTFPTILVCEKLAIIIMRALWIFRNRGVVSRTSPQIRNRHSAIPCIAFLVFLDVNLWRKFPMNKVCNVWSFG